MRRNRVPVAACGVEPALGVVDKIPISAEEREVWVSLLRRLLQSTKDAIEAGNVCAGVDVYRNKLYPDVNNRLDLDCKRAAVYHKKNVVCRNAGGKAMRDADDDSSGSRRVRASRLWSKKVPSQRWESSKWRRSA